jgi:uncharacterized membrane protein
MITLLVTLAIIGFVVWFLTSQVPMAEPFKIAIYFIAVLCALFLVMRAFGIADIPLRG